MKQIIATLALAFFVSLSSTPVSAFFEAGQQSNWPLTNDMLAAKIDSSWKFAPTIYTLGQSITVTSEVENTSSTNSFNKDIYLYVSKVLESPKGTDVSSGLPGLTDADLNTNEQAGNDKQEFPTSYSVGNLALLPGEKKNVSFTFTVPTAGYYQVDYSTLVPGNGYVQGFIFAAGFIRVLPSGDPVVTPTSALRQQTASVQVSSTPGQAVGSSNTSSSSSNNSNPTSASAGQAAEKQGSVQGVSALADTGEFGQNLPTIMQFAGTLLLLSALGLSLRKGTSTKRIIA